MSSVLKGYKIEPLTEAAIAVVSACLPEFDHLECSALLDITPDAFLREVEGYKKQIVDSESGLIIGCMGVTDLGGGIATPWILLVKRYRKPDSRLYLTFAKEVLAGLIDGTMPFDTLLVMKLTTNTEQIRLLKLLGFQKNPDVTIIGHQGGELHEYFIKRSTNDNCSSGISA